MEIAAERKRLCNEDHGLGGVRWRHPGLGAVRSAIGGYRALEFEREIWRVIDNCVEASKEGGYVGCLLFITGRVESRHNM
jgi:hypothetical protein